MAAELHTMPLTHIITAIGGLGTAAFGLVDASKGVFSSINRMGLKHIEQAVTELTPDQSGVDRTGAALPARPVNALPRKNILETIAANWVNGNDLVSQKS